MIPLLKFIISPIVVVLAMVAVSLLVAAICFSAVAHKLGSWVEFPDTEE